MYVPQQLQEQGENVFVPKKERNKQTNKDNRILNCYY